MALTTVNMIHKYVKKIKKDVEQSLYVKKSVCIQTLKTIVNISFLK